MHENGKPRFSAKISLSHSTRKIPGNHFQVSEFLGSRKLFSISRFSYDFFCLEVAKNFVRNHIMFETLSNIRFRKKTYAKEPKITTFSRKFFVSECRKTSLGNTTYIRKVRLSKNFMPKRVISLFSVEFMSRLLPIIFVTESLFVSEFLRHRRL